MTTATLEPLAAADVLRAEEFYCAANVESLLGIPEHEVLRAIRDHRVPYSQYKGHGDAIRVTGTALLAWITRDKVRHEATEVARSCHRNEQEEAARKARVEQGQALERAWSSPAAQLLKHWNERPVDAAAWREYSELLRRSEFALDDVEVLSGLMGRLGLTVDQVRTDRRALLLALQG